MMTTEVQRILAGFRQSNMAGDELLQKFRSATRGDMKLACAIQGFLLEEDCDEYLKYLLMRVRPAVTELMQTGNISALERLAQRGVFTSDLTDYFLKQAIDTGAQDAMIWLLQWKAERFGFCDRDFSLAH